MAQSSVALPRSNVLGFSIESDHTVIPPVGRLRGARVPTAIVFGISFVVFLSFDSGPNEPRISHIFQKRLESDPSRIDGYSAPSVMLPVCVVGVVAPTLHPSPRKVYRAFLSIPRRMPVRGPRFLGSLSGETSTGFRGSIFETCRAHFFDSSAVASTQAIVNCPILYAENFSFSNDCQTAEFCSDHFRKIYTVLEL